MPQDRFKSSFYKSIIICDDPKGVVECGTRRKMKSIAQQMEHKIESGKPPKQSTNCSTTKDEKADKGEMVAKQVTEKSPSPSTSQLLEIARGAQKLNEMIESWSNGLNGNTHPKYIGKNLLKGALELQESINMLANLREDSQYMVKLNKKQDCFETGSSYKMATERIDSDRFRDRDYSGFQNPRLSTDGTSQRCVDDLKEVIRNSLSRQNLLLGKSFEECCFHQRYFESPSEIPSTSSSQSSTVHTDIFGSVDSSSSSMAPQNMTNGPNLIAKLMGLEEVASEQSQMTLQKQLESEKVFNRRKPIVDIDMPNAKNSQFTAPKVDQEKRTSTEIHEAAQYKGLLKCNSSKWLKPQSHNSSDSYSKEIVIAESSPIVLIKPCRVSGTSSGRSLPPSLGNKEAFGERKTVKKQITKGKPNPETYSNNEEVLLTKLDTKDNPVKLGEKREVEETMIKRLSPEEKAGCFKSLSRKQSVREVKAMEKAPNKMKPPGLMGRNLQDKAVNNKRNDKIQKATFTSKRTAEKGTLNSKYVSKPQNKQKSSGTKQAKAEDGSKIPKSKNSRQQNATSHSISKHTAVRNDSSDQKKNQTTNNKLIRQAGAARLNADNLQYNSYDKQLDNVPGHNDVTAAITDGDSQEIPTEERASSTKFETEEHLSENHDGNFVSGCPVENFGYNRDSYTFKATKICVADIKEDGEATGSNLKSLLLSSPSFLSLAEESFDFHMNCPVTSRTTGNKDYGIITVSLLLDCANELVKRRSLPDASIVHPLSLKHACNLRIFICLDQLVEEVCDGIEFLRSYCKLIGEDIPADGLYAMMEKDMTSKDVTNAIWDLGWRNGFSVGDAEELVYHVENLVLNELIEEVFS